MKLLAIETATDACSSALEIDGESRTRYQIAPRQHAERLLPMVNELLAEAGLGLRDLDGVAFGRGPGSFTGVRIAASVAQGLAFGADLPVAGVSSLRALAQGVRRERGKERVLSAFDARMSEVYWGVFVVQEGIMSPVLEEGVFAPDLVPVPQSPGDWFGAGDGWGVYQEILCQRAGNLLEAPCANAYPQAIDVASLGRVCFERGEGVPAEDALPVYLRDKVTREPEA